MYRAFTVTSGRGYGGWFELSAPSDEAALVAVRNQTHRTPVDVWCSGRFVGRVEHGDVEAHSVDAGAPGWSGAGNTA